MKKVLFIDRDGTLIVEPLTDQQVDSHEKLDYVPGVFSGLIQIAQKLDYELVMVTNQDGLGTESFPEEDFWPTHNRMMATFEAEGINFAEVHIDRSFPADNAPTRKPRTGLLQSYFSDEYDLANSYVIGDRLTDVELAKNLGSKAIFIGDQGSYPEIESAGFAEFTELITTSWSDVFAFLASTDRSSTVKRTTKETSIEVSLDLDGKGPSSFSTGLGFFDHMLEQISKHAGVQLTVNVKGDLEVDEHHTIEDTALALGQAFKEALGDKRGIERYGFSLPMDDCSAHVLLDFGGRPWLVWDAPFTREKVGDMPTEMFLHFFKSFSDASASNLNIKAEGENEHHKIEGIFKAFARAIKMAIKRDIFNFDLPSTKGVL